MMETWLPHKLRVLRMRQGLTLIDAAKKTGVTRATLSELERGHRHPVAPTLVKIAKGYGVPVEELLEEPVPLASAPSASPPPDVAAAEAGRPEESAEARESVDYRKLHLELGYRLIGQLKETLAMLADVLPTDDYAEFVKYPFEEQRWRIETAERLNALAEKIIESIEDEEVTLTPERRDELAERRRELDAASVVIKEFRKAS
jgi:transcriptional regulator with XRE-family HTH domain